MPSITRHVFEGFPQLVLARQVNTAVSNIDKVTQANSAAAEQTAAASEELNAQATELRVLVGRLECVVHGNAKSADLAVGDESRHPAR